MNALERKQIVEKLLGEQQMVHGFINQWRDWWCEVKEMGQPDFGEMSRRISKIRDELEKHFQHEENSAEIRELAAIVPNVQDQMSVLKQEHAELLMDLNVLLKELEECEEQHLCWGAARDAFEAFLNKLEQHEQRENQLLKTVVSPG